MAIPQFLLLQKEASPYSGLLEQALKNEKSRRVFKRPSPPLPDWLAPNQALVIWDLCGFGPRETQQIIPELGREGVGLVLVCRDLAQLANTGLAKCLINQLLVAPGLAGEVEAALAMGLLNHQRICQGLNQLKAERQRMRERELVERAKAVLMKSLCMGEAEALRQMQNHSRNTNQKLWQVARFVLAAEPMFGNGAAEMD